MADVIMSGACRTARQHRKHRRGAVERLDLGLLINAQHDGPLWGIQVETDDVADLGHEQRVLGQLPRILFVRCQTERPPDPRHHRLRQSQMVGHRPRRPVSRIRGCGLQRCGDQGFDLLIADHTRSARSRFVKQPVTSLLGESVAPLTNRAPVEFKPFGDFDVDCRHRQHASTIRARRANPAALVAPPSPAFQLTTFVVGQHDLGSMRRRHHPY